MKEPFKCIQQPSLKNPSLIVGWNKDAGKVSPTVIDFLNEKLGGRMFCEIDLENFFTFGGVAVEDDIAEFPESKFYYNEQMDVVFFKSDQPHLQHYKFLNTVLDIAENICHVTELYTVSGFVSSFIHTSPRKVFSVFNLPEFRDKFQGYGLEDLTWEGPPAMSTYLLWIARERGLPGLSLWPEIPFYLGAHEDPQSVKNTLFFLNNKFHLNLDLTGFDNAIREQNEKIALLRQENDEIDRYLKLLESGLHLEEEEQVKLAREIYSCLKQ
jgi:proteasome assembly chaperone (PAC2) family protein